MHVFSKIWKIYKVSKIVIFRQKNFKKTSKTLNFPKNLDFPKLDFKNSIISNIQTLLSEIRISNIKISKILIFQNMYIFEILNFKSQNFKNWILSKKNLYFIEFLNFLKLDFQKSIFRNLKIIKNVQM